VPFRIPGFAPHFPKAFLVALAGGLLLAVLLAWLHRRLATRQFLGLVLRRLVPVTAVTLPLLAVTLYLRRFPGTSRGFSGHLLLLVWILFGGWIGLRLLRITEDVLGQQLARRADDDGRRAAATRVGVLFLWMRVLTVVLTVGLALMSFPRVRVIGASLLASAGLLGIVFGMAARPVLTNLIAGIQLALTQPLKLGDTLTVGGTQGVVEDIRATYVLLRVWDGRRLVVPLTYFVEQPFENYTHRGRELLGTVKLWVDLGVPLDDLRDELRRLCAASSDWDGKTCSLAVSDVTPEAMQIGAVVGSSDGARLPALSSAVREGLLAYLRRSRSDAWPRRRNENTGP
jgi:small-conductance mechanosensitive channel